MNYYIAVLKKYAVFTGRASRKEYWMFVLFNVLASLIFSLVDNMISEGSSTLNSLYSLAVFIPSLAVAVRRVHDVSKSGWFVLIPIYNLVLLCTKGTPGSNTYGPEPKELK